MTVALVAALVAVVIAHIWLADRKDKRAHTERAVLLQRIQAPHAAVAEHHAAVDPPAPDEGGLPMSDEQLAELEEKNRLIRWMEQMENGGGPFTGEPVDGVAP